MVKNDLLYNIIEGSEKANGPATPDETYYLWSNNEGIQYLVSEQYSKIENYHGTSLTQDHINLLNKKFNMDLDSGRIFVQHAPADQIFGEPYYTVTITY